MHKRSLLWLVLFFVLAICGTVAIRAQNSAEAASVLRPPKGAKVALVVFEDLECPDCARAAPLVEEAARTYKIPVVRYDFPLPQHLWSFDAAVLARYFAGKSAALGVEYREYIFRHQQEITGSDSRDGAAQKQRLRALSEQFAAQHKIKLPFVVDPQGKLAAEVRHSRQVGKDIGITHTPTLYVVSSRRAGTPFVEVVDRTKLFNLIDQMKSQAE